MKSNQNAGEKRSSRVKYRYYFPAIDGGTVFKHLHLYERWVQAARSKGVPMRLVTFVPMGTYAKHRHQFRMASDRLPLTVVPTPAKGKANAVTIAVYFLLLTLFSDRVVVHVRKSATGPLEHVKSFVDGDLQYMLDYEGDTVAEAEYLGKGRAEVDAAASRQRYEVEGADHVIYDTEMMQSVIAERYPNASLRSNSTVLPTYYPEHVSFSSEGRRRVREKLGVGKRPVFVYLGSVERDWQNVPEAVRHVAAVSDHLDKQPFLLLLVHEREHETARRIASTNGLSEDQFDVRAVPHEAVGDYLSGADLGIVLRDDHTMNEVTYPAKYVEYLASGLPVLTTAVLPGADELAAKQFGTALPEPKAFEPGDVVGYLNHDPDRRREIGRWSTRQFGTEHLSPTYAKLLRSLASSDQP